MKSALGRWPYQRRRTSFFANWERLSSAE